MLDWPTAAVIMTALCGVVVAFLRINPNANGEKTALNDRHEIQKMHRELATLQASVDALQKNLEQLHKGLAEVRTVLLDWGRETHRSQRKSASS